MGGEEMTVPRVSVCMPVYNNDRYLAESIESVLKQHFEDFEIVVIDDCSTDRTAEIAREFAAQDPRIRFLINPENLGMVPNWNRCMELAQGTYIKYLFGDDLFSSPETLGLMVQAMELTPGASMVSSARTIINEQSHTIDTLSPFPGNFTADGREVIRRCLRRITRDHNLIGEPSVVMFRRDAAVRGFDCRYRQLVDLEMWFHLLEQGPFAYLAEPLCSFRHHGEQQTKKNAAELNFIDDLTYLFDDYLGKPYVGIGRIARVYLMYYQFYKLQKHALQGQYDMALVRKKISHLYGPWRFALLRPLYRLYTPYWQMKRMIGRALGKE
jgi:glycosyltransferase involved in cell wall biosynthesis